MDIDSLEQPSRRDVIKGAKKTGVVLAGVAGVAAGKELGILARDTEKTVNTPSGRFTGIYDVHSETGAEKQLNLPKGTDVLFQESPRDSLAKIFADPEGSITAGPEELGEGRKALPNRTLIQASNERIPIMFGDVIPDSFQINLTAGAQIAEGTVGLISLYLRNQLNREESAGKAAGTGRRRILKAGLAAAAAWGLSPSVGKVADSGTAAIKTEATRNLLSQCSNLLTLGHPEDLTVFLRNAVMADKLLKVSEVLDEKSNRKEKPHIAFHVGYQYRGIEDFLAAGRDTCRAVIASYPGFVLKDVVEKNGGLTTFSSSLLYQLPKDLTVPELHANAFQGKSTIITDAELKHAIRDKIT